jgi:hypothetical protein
MKTSITNKLHLLIFTLGAFLLYSLVLKVGIPKAFAAPFRENSTFLFLIIILLFFLMFRLPKKISWGLGLTFTLLIFAFTLLYLWTSGFTNNAIIGGLLPYKDGKYYFWGVNMILNGDLISTNSAQAAGRPLFPGFLSVPYLLVGGNLKWATALIVGLAGFAAFSSAFYFSRQLGSLVAAVYIALLYLYMQPLLGFNRSELAGFIFGCFGCVLMWKAARELKISVLIMGLLVTMFAVSARAGTFLIFPAFILWAGWAFRGSQKFSFRVAIIASATVLVTFVLMNIIYPKLVVEPGAMTNGNFAYTLYGQVRGGVGWNEAIKATGTRNPHVIYRAAWDFFLRHPLSLPLGILKSFRDFFGPTEIGMFPMSNSLSGIVFYLFGLILIILNLFQVSQKRSNTTFLMLLASFLGIFLSIPFLPPIDAGSRFYASTAPFFFLFVAYPFCDLPIQEKNRDPESFSLGRLVELLSVGGILLIFFGSISIQRLAQPLQASVPTCPPQQVPFAVRIYPDSYIDLIPDLDLDSNCGLVPNVCQSDFVTNGTNAQTDDFYQELTKQVMDADTIIRIVVYSNFIEDKANYLLGTADQLQPVGNHAITGCAVRIKTEHQKIYRVISVISP